MTFGKCCHDWLPGNRMNEIWKDLAREERWPEVLMAIRADLTQYSIYHRTNTVPLMRVMPREKIEILTIDIEALHETVEQLAAAYSRTGQLATFPAVIERLRRNVDDPRWDRKLTYQQAITAHVLDDTEGARRELAKLGPITPDEADLEVLQLNLDLNGATLPLVDKLPLYDRVIEIGSRTDRIQYSAAKGVELTLAGDMPGAAAIADCALERARSDEAERPFGSRTQLWMAKLLEVAGIAKKDRGLFDEAAERLGAMVSETDIWPPAGRGHLYRCLGDVERFRGAWEAAAAAYSAGYQLDGNPACQIFKAMCELMLGRKAEALATIEAVDVNGLEPEESMDHAIAFAAIAIGLRDLALLDRAAARLTAAQPARQYFDNQRLQHLVAIDRARAAIVAGQPVPKSSRLLDWIGTFSRWFMIQPNIAGIGVNFNAVIDDALAAKRRGSGEEPEKKA